MIGLHTFFDCFAHPFSVVKPFRSLFILKAESLFELLDKNSQEEQVAETTLSNVEQSQSVKRLAAAERMYLRFVV